MAVNRSFVSASSRKNLIHITPEPWRRKPTDKIAKLSSVLSNGIVSLGVPPPDFIALGSKLGYKIAILKNKPGFNSCKIDMRIIASTRVLIIISEPLVGIVSTAFNVAKEYGLKTIWINKYSYPGTKLLSFDHIFVGKRINSYAVWDVICQSIE
jgi:hypothetical protein